jgi:tetratricopeptide (TPR) repeat protein
VARQPKRKKQDTTGLVLEEVESIAERIAAWIQANAWLSIGVVAGSLLLAAAYGGYDSWQTRREERASDALDQVRSSYLEAMGTAPNALEIPELANPEAGRQISQEYAKRFRAVVDEHPNTVAAVLAALALGDVSEAAGNAEPPIEVWRETLAELPTNSPLRGLLLHRIAQAEEDAGLWAEAAETHAQAGAIEAFPLRHLALLDAARCFARAGQSERALELFERLEAEAPQMSLPAHLRGLAAELRAASAR